MPTIKERMNKILSEKREAEKKLNEAIVAEENQEARKAQFETLKSIRNEIDEAERIIDELDEPAKDETVDVEIDGRSMKKVAGMEARKAESENVEARAKAFKESNKMSFSINESRSVLGCANKEARSVLVSSGKIATPTEVDPDIRNIWNTVSSIVDLVKVTDAEGMGAYKVAYQTADAQAAEQTEGQSYNSSDPTFGYVTIMPTTYAVLSSISKQVQKQTPLQYQAKVRESSLYALRRKAAALVTNAIVGSDLTQALPLDTLDDKALRTIAFNYGGDDAIVGEAWLFLNKKDLITLGDIRSSVTKQAAFEITPDTANPNTGVIKDGGLSMRYCLNSALEEGTMIYGQPYNFELALFSNYDIRASEDFMFDKGMLAIRGDVELGGDVTKQDGFILVTVGGTPTSA